VRTNTVTQADITGLKNYKNADGQIFQSKTFVIRTLKIGNLEVVKVQAKFAPANAPTSSRGKASSNDSNPGRSTTQLKN